MLYITTDFESGNGKAIEQINENDFRLETSGESSSYSDYFCIRILNDGKECRDCSIEVLRDRTWEYSDADDYQRADNLPLWVRKDNAEWIRILDYEKIGTLRKIRLEINPGAILCLTTDIPLPYSEMYNDLKNKYDRTGLSRLYHIGMSFQGRDIPLLSIGNGNKRILVISGLHGTEFAGIWAGKGIIEFLLSEDPDAKAIRNNFTVDIIPYGNPDGTVMGKPRTNAEGIDIYREANPGKTPLPAEIPFFWKWIDEHPPVLYINLHGWNACERGKEPYEGAVRAALPGYEKYALCSTVLNCDQSLIKHANPISRYNSIHELGITHSAESDNLINLLAQKYGTIGYCYEPNMRTGITGCQQKGTQILLALTRALSV